MTYQYSSFNKSLLAWYRKSARDLPWRKTSDPYKIWISEVMLQQTTVAAATPYYDRWLKKFPNIESVATAPLQTILKAWQGLGYYSRARNIHATAKIITKEYAGIFPDKKEHLRKLPGLGPYTVGAVLSIAFDQREPIIDANVRRVVMRQLKIMGKATPEHDKEILGFLLNVMPQKDNRSFNQALMELGALVCRSKSPTCLTCPVRQSCVAHREGVEEIIPEPKKMIVKDIFAAIAIIEHEGKYFLQRRPKGKIFADLWEFPGGKIEKRETAHAAAVREVKEELGIDVQILKNYGEVVHFYTQFKANLSLWLCRPLTMPKVDKHHKWLSLSDLKKYPVPSGSAKIIELLAKKRG